MSTAQEMDSSHRIEFQPLAVGSQRAVPLG